MGAPPNYGYSGRRAPPLIADVRQLMSAFSRSVEDLLDQVAALAPSKLGESHSLFVADALTFRDKVLSTDLAMAIVLDALLAKGLFPDGFTEMPGGRQYHYKFEGNQ